MSEKLIKKLREIANDHLLDDLTDLSEIVESTLLAISDDTEENEPQATNSIRRMRDTAREVVSTIDEAVQNAEY